MNLSKLSLLSISFVALFATFFAVPVLAADPEPPIKDDAYAVRYAGQSLPDPLKIEAGATKTVEFRFKNTGTATLQGKGSRYVAAYTVQPRYHSSLFQAANWAAADETAGLYGSCAPGAICTLQLQLKAPEKVGTYKEEFHLAAKYHSWVKGGYFWIELQVVAPEKIVTPAPKEEAVTEEEKEVAPVLQANRFGQSKKKVSAAGGEKVTVAMVYHNSGEQAWTGYTLETNEPTAIAAVSKTLTFADTKWHSATRAKTVSHDVAPGAYERISFSFRTPTKKGSYPMTFALYADGTKIAGSDAAIEVTVTSDAPSHYEEPDFRTPSKVVPKEEVRLAEEPSIKVGIWKVDKNYVLITPQTDSYKVYAGGAYQGILPKGKTATLKLRDDIYSLKAGDLNVKSDKHIRLVPENNPHAVFKVDNLDREYQRVNFDEYRGVVEYRKVQNDDQIYVINDVLMSDYVAGMGENSDGSPEEYLKAQSVAQRTYGYFIKEYSNKHEKRNFDVVAHTGDQLYLGYKSEAIRPNFVKASKATRGFMVTYDTDNDDNTATEVVITPYFARTDGRTRSWKEVWGGHKPWLVSVPTVYDRSRGRRMYGHGVGMSQLDASDRASKLGEDWQTIVKYYYTDTEIVKMYK
ncbi:MAG: hypothetical protein HOE53_04215 [Candidatus Magasanikbacteria bacterium]|jgi:hypothetical protein|nr:hypothetical protein [Candidatus Magasanikbacteria bacterium]